MKRLRLLRKSLGAGTLILYMLSNSVYAVTVPNVDIVPQRETPAFLHIDVPSDLARVEDIYEAPPKVDPSLVVHIQNAHGNYEAQNKIKHLMNYLYKQYGFRLFFVEGAVGKLNPDYLKLFADADHNRQVADSLAREGKLTGAELFLVDAPQGIQASGIEQPDLYRSNYETFREVYSYKDDTNAFLERNDQRLNQIAAKVFSPELRRLVQEWKKFEAGQRDFMPYVERLSGDARKILDLDLESIYAQAEWPHLSRLLILQSMEKDLDMEAGRKQKADVVKALQQLEVSAEVVKAIQDLEERKITMNRLEPQDERLENLPRHLIERLLEEGTPKGFNLSDYPEFALYAGYFILKSEVDSKPLFDEIERLFEKILDRLASSEKDRKILTLFRDQETLRKFLSVELGREEWDRFLDRQSVLELEAFEKRIQKHEDVQTPLRISENAIKAFQAGVKFYRLARQRDLVFYYRIKQGMLKENEEKSTLLTGGFHTDGVFERFRREEVNYGVLMPKIGGEINRDNYLKTMLDTHPSMFKAATIEAPSLMASFQELQSLGVQDFLRGIEWPLEAAVKKNLTDWVPRGTTAKDYYSAADFAASFNQSPAAQLRQSALLLAPTTNDYAYLFAAGQFVRNAEGQYRVIRTTEVKNALGEKVLVFGTVSDWVSESPESQGLQPQTLNFAAPLDQSGAAADLGLPANLEAEAALPVQSVVSDEAVKRQARVEALRNLIMINPQVQSALEKPGDLRRYFDLFSALNLRAEFEAVGANERARQQLAERAASLVAFGFAPLDAGGEDLVGYFAWVHSLSRDARSEADKGMDAIKAQAGTFSSDLPGTLVTVKTGLPTESEVVGIEAQLALNPKLNLYFAVAVPEGSDPAEFRKALRDVEKSIRDLLIRQGVPSPDKRFTMEASAATPAAVRRVIEGFFNKRIKPGLAEKSAVDFRSADNAFAILATDDTAGRFELNSVIDGMSATLIESEPIEEDLRNPERFAAATLAQRLNTSDKSGVQAVKLKESTAKGANKREWEIDKKGLTFIQKAIEDLTEAFKGLLRLDASA